MKGNFNEDIDKKITDCLNYKAEEISAPHDMLFEIRSNIRNENRLRSANKKVRFFKVKIIIAIGVLCVAITVPVAAEIINLHWFSQKSEIACGINQFPTADTVKNTLGYLPKYEENFCCGFKFKSFNIFDNCVQDSTENKVINTKVGEFKYAKDGANENQYLKVTAAKIDKKYFDENVKNIGHYDIDNNGNIIYFSWIVRKDVPKDYVKTEEDLKFIKKGIMELDYGADETNIYSVNYVIWYEDNIQYMIINKGYKDIDIPELIRMAKTVRYQ